MSTQALSSIVSRTSVRYHTLGFSPGNPTLVYDRFQRIPGANQQALTRAHVVLVGGGGLNGEMGHGLVRKGVGHLSLYDFDTVDWSNLARQQFYREDVGQKKALALAKNLARQATGRSLIEGQAYAFQEAVANGLNLKGQVAVIGVDNNATRLAAAEYYLAHGLPALFLGVDRQAARGYVFVQTAQPGDPCFQCLSPDAPSDQRIHGCAGASIEILKLVAGIALYAIDSLLMARPRPWNYKAVFLDGGGDGQRTIGQRAACPLCGGRTTLAAGLSSRVQPEVSHG